MATYRSTYENFYTDKQGSYTAIGAIVPTFANRHTTSITETGYTPPPNQSINPPHYTQKGFLYCDGLSYDINDYPALYDIIKNTYNDDTDVNSLTNPINNNSILFTDNGTAGSFYRTFVDGGNLYAEVYQKSYTPPGSGVTYKSRSLPNNCEVTFVGGMGAMPGGGIFTADSPKVLEFNSSYQSLKTSGQDTTVHRFIVGTATETVDVNWSISSNTLIQTQDTYPILPIEYYGTVPKNDPTSFNTTGYDEYTDAENWSPQLSWGGLTGLPTAISVDTWEIYLQDMSNANQIQWHITNIPATTTSINANAASLPAGATIIKNTVDRAATPRPLASSPNEWVTTTGYSGPQPDTNTKNIYRFNVIARLSNGQACIAHLDFTAGTSSTAAPINNTGNITWSNFLAASSGSPIDKTLGFDEDITAGRAVGAGGLVFDPPTDISYNFKLEIYDPSGNGNTKSRVWSDASTSGAWVNHGTGWTTIAQTTQGADGSRPTGTLHKLEAVRYDNAANNAGWAAVRIDGEFRLIDVRPEPLESSPHYEDSVTVKGLAGGVSSTTFNQDWTSFGAYTETGGGVRKSPIGMTIGVAGTGYTAATGVATTGGGTGLTVDTTVTNGAITAIAVNNPGSGYTVGNIITVTGGNSDARLTVTNTQNVISGHPKVRVRKVYNGSDYPQLLGKFKIPDYRERKLIGMGEGVAGAGTPLVEARSAATVGGIGGKWILPTTTIDDPAEFFTISDVVTSGYSSVNTQIQAYLTGSKKITIGPMEEYFFNRPPEHDHQLLHSSRDETYPASMGGMDRFSTGYSNVKGAILDFEPATADGEALGHSHGLLDSRPVNSAMTTYGNSAGVGDRQQKFSGGTLSTVFGNSNLPTYSDQGNNALPFLNSLHPVIHAFDGAASTYCDMTMESNANWSMLTFGTPIANVTKVVVGYDGAAHVGYNTGNLVTSGTGSGSRQTVTIHNGSATTINNLYFVTQGTPLAGSGTGYARLYDVKMTIGGTETELKQDGSGCYEYAITEPPNVPTDTVTSDGTTVTITTTTEHGLVVGDWVVVSGAGFTGEAVKYNGTFQVISDNWNAQRISYTPTSAPASGTAASSNTVIREAAGYFQDQTNTPSPNVWSVDALPVVIGGKPIFSTDPDQYGDPLWTQTLTSANSFTQSFNSSDDVRGYFFVMRAPGGGGGTSANNGGNGGNASVNFTLNVNGSPVTYTVTLQGGRGGTKGDSGGAGGSGGVVTITSTDGNPNALLNDDRVTFSTNAQGNGGASGGANDESTPAGGIGGTPDDATDGGGGQGSYATTPASGNFYEPASGSHTSNGSYNASNDNRIPAQSSIDYIELEAIGGAGGHGAKNLQGNCPTPGSTYDGYGGDRGKGRKITGITGSSNGTNPTPQFATNFEWTIGGEGGDGQNQFTGVSWEASTTGGSGAGGSKGGSGGGGAWGNGSSAGAGGGATGIKIPGASWLLGAGGGGGAGAGGGGDNGAGWIDLCWNGGNGRDPVNTNYISTAIAPSGFSNSQNGGSSGCTAGGGGGGGGGFGGGGTGDGGAGGQAGAGHVNTGSGDGGYAGRSAANSQFLTSVPTNSYEGTDAGGSVRFRVFYTGNAVEKSGGGGGAGAEVSFSITGTTSDIQSQVSASLGSYGSAGAGGSPTAAGNGGDGYVYVRALPIQEGGQQILDYTIPAGRVYSVPGFGTNAENWATVGTGSTGNLADIWHTSSTDVARIAPAAGTFVAMANHSTVPAGHPTNNFFRFTGEGDRWLRMGPLDLTSAEQLVFSVIKGNGTNGGAAPEEALELQYNTDVDSNSYTDIQQIATSSDGTTGGYFNKTITLDPNNPARTTGVYLLVKQTRPANSGDNANNTEDEWGISQFGIIYGPVTTRVFVPAVSAFLPGNEGSCGPDTGINEIRKEITAGDSNIRFTDGTFTLSSSTPVSVSVTATPKKEISLLTRYHRAKYLIKAF